MWKKKLTLRSLLAEPKQPVSAFTMNTNHRYEDGLRVLLQLPDSRSGITARIGPMPGPTTRRGPFLATYSSGKRKQSHSHRPSPGHRRAVVGCLSPTSPPRPECPWSVERPGECAAVSWTGGITDNDGTGFRG